jgi:molecular chaperone DnaK (HSP70)
MKIGVDFGTTRVVVAAVDRGNYPVVAFEGPDGETYDWFPPVVAVRGDERRYGFAAWQVQEQGGWTVVRSVKRLLADAGLNTRIDIGGQVLAVQDLLRELAGAIGRAIRERSTLALGPGEALEAMLGVPANANSNQRFLSAEGFRQAGVKVLGVLNEPSAASIEFGHRARVAGDALKRRTLLVYDFGGGTFDASLVELDEQVHEVIDSEGVPTVGGDDFDELLAEMALDAAEVPAHDRDELSQDRVFRLYELCRAQKEALHPNTRRIVVDLETVHPEWPAVTIPAAEFFERCAPLVDRTLEATEALLARQGLDVERDTGKRRLDTVYAIGGASELPIVGRRLRERYGRHVRRSSYGRSSTAIGLAIQADAEAGYVLRERFTRYFGVWREADAGATAVFDPLFERGTALPGAGDPAISTSRTYHPAHNLGHFRFLECSQLTPGGQPAGDILHWDEIRFPFTPALSEADELSNVPVHYDSAATQQRIQEQFACDASGSVVVTLANLTAGYARTYPLGHWGARTAPIKPGRRRTRVKS